MSSQAVLFNKSTNTLYKAVQAYLSHSTQGVLNFMRTKHNASLPEKCGNTFAIGLCDLPLCECLSTPVQYIPERVPQDGSVPCCKCLQR